MNVEMRGKANEISQLPYANMALAGIAFDNFV